jgi:DNA-binding PadR family transcriptional regulator
MNQYNAVLKGSLSAIILKLLDENGRMYGYEITRKVKEMTEGELQVTEGALYPALHKLEAEGILITETEICDGRARKYYALTAHGKTEAAFRINGLLESLSYIQRILNPGRQYHETQH